jgi:hypothetical protein
MELSTSDVSYTSASLLEKTVYDVLHSSNEIKDPRLRAMVVLKAVVE